MTLALHGKSRQRQLFLLILALVTVGAAVFAGTVVQRAERAAADPPWSVNSSGVFTSTTGGGSITGLNTNQLRWGDPIPAGGSKSGYDFVGVSTPSVVTNTEFDLGTFTHLNFPIDVVTGISGATLEVTLAFPAPIGNVPFSFPIDHWETPNNDDPCADGGENREGVNENGCADRVQFTNGGVTSTTFSEDGNTYTLQVKGFRSGTCPSGAGTVTEFWTVENQTNDACLIGEIIPVQPDLTVTKTPSQAEVEVGEAFTWTWNINNASFQANFVDGAVVLEDQLPSGATYSNVVAPASLSCAIDGSNLLTCTANGDLAVPVGSNQLTVAVTVTPSTSGDLVNAEQKCVNPDDTPTESNPDNNNCSSTVTVTAPTTNGLTVKKMVWDGDEYVEWDGAPDFWDLSYKLTSGGTLNSVDHAATTQIPFGSYTVSESIPAGWQRAGVSNVANPSTLTCPSTPDSPTIPPIVGETTNTGTAGVDIDADTSRLVCFYNQPLVQVTVEKMVRDSSTGAYTAWDGAADFWGLAYGTTTYGAATPLESGASANIPIGPYFFWEDLAAGWQFNGFVTTGDASCAAEPGDLSGTASSTPGPQQTTTQSLLGTDPVRICFYNERDLEPVTVEKEGTGTYDIDWTVTKSIVGEDTKTVADDGSATFDFDLAVTRNETFNTSGTITIGNPNQFTAIEITSIADPGVTITGGGCNPSVGTPTEISAGGELVCNWSADDVNPLGYSNSVTVTWRAVGDDGAGAEVSDTVEIGSFTLANGSEPNNVDLSDLFEGKAPESKGSFSDSGTTTHQVQVACQDIQFNADDYNSNGLATIEFDNVARISGVGDFEETSDPVTVTLDCQRPKLTLIKDVEGGDAAATDWVLTATGDPYTFSGQTGVFSYVPSESVFTLSESNVPGYRLDRIVCEVNGREYPLDLSDDDTATVQLFGGAQDTTCTFYNVSLPTLTLTKSNANGITPSRWTMDISQDSQELASGAGSTSTIVNPGETYELGETGPFNTGDAVSLVCESNGQELLNTTFGNQQTDDNGGRTALSLPVPSDQEDDIDCVYTNKLEPITVNAWKVVCDAERYLPNGAIATPITKAAIDAFLATEDAQEGNCRYDNNTFMYAPSGTANPGDNETSASIGGWTNFGPSAGETPATVTVDITSTSHLWVRERFPAGAYVPFSGVAGGNVSAEMWCSYDRLNYDNYDRVENGPNSQQITPGETYDCVALNAFRDGSVDVQKTVDWTGVPAANQPDDSFDICIAGPFEDMTAASDFLDGLTGGFAPDTAPAGAEWLECDTVTDTEFAEFDNLVPGAYAVAEKDPGAAYEQITGPFAVNVGPGDEQRLDGLSGINNEYQRGDLTVTKNIELAGGDLPADSEFTICIQGPSYPTGDEAGACRTFETDDQAETWGGLVPGDYIVSEPETEPDGVQWATTITNSGDVTVPAGGEASATVTNTLVTGDLAVTKVIEWSGYTPDAGDLDGNPWDGFEICIEGPSYPLGTEDGACQVVTNIDGETLQWDNLAAGTYTVTETEPGTQWEVVVDPANAGSVGVETCDPTDGACEPPQVTITNTLAPADLTICKDFVGEEDSVLPGITIDGQAVADPDWGDDDCFTVEVAPLTPLTIAEVLPEGYLPAQEPTLNGQCTIQQEEVILADFVIAQTLSFLGLELNEDWLEADLSGIPAGGSCEVTFTNEPVGELVIVKADNVGDGDNTWTFPVTDGETNDAAVIIGSDSDSNTVRTGTYIVSEEALEGPNRVDVCEVTSPAGSYQVRVQVNGGEPVLSTTAEVAVTRGQTTTVTFYNDDCGRILGGANLFVNKFEATAEGAFSGTTGLEGWTMELTCIAGECESGGFPGALDTDASGLASFGQVPSGVYEVCEVPQSGYEVVGSLLEGSDPVNGTCREVTVTEEAAGPDGNIVVDFFNYPLGGLRVEKRQLEGGALDATDNGGWEITVEGCGESFTQTTNEAIPNSWTVFENLPACDEYVVSENVNSKPGYTPVGPDSYEFSFTPGDDLVFTFVNDTVPENTPTPTPPTEETPTPTNTPENTPTNTPEPTETPVDPTETPTPIDEVEGEITPGTPTEDAGEQSTPIPPASGTGNGILGGSTGSSMFLVLLALLMTSTGLAALAMARGRANGGNNP